VAAVGGLVLFGLWAISGITRHDVPGSPNYYVMRQAIFAAVGIPCAAVAIFVDPDVYRRSYKTIYTGTIGLMVLVFLARPLTRGSKRWIDPGFFRFQPSAFGKLLFVLALAGFIAARSRRRDVQRAPVASRRRRRPLPRPRRGQRDADDARLPARARDRLRVRLARRAARLPRRGRAALPLPARRLARPADRGHSARPVLGDRRRWNRRRALVPDLRERGDDDGDRADHGHPAPVCQRRRLVDDREPSRDGGAAGDPRASTRGGPALLLLV